MAARNLSFTRAGLELRVTQAAISHQVKGLEEILGVPLFRRLPRGLALTEGGGGSVAGPERHLPVALPALWNGSESGRLREVLTLGAVGTFVTGWLLPRLADFHASYPFVDLRLLTNNNRVDLAGEGLDCAIRFGDGRMARDGSGEAICGATYPALRTGAGSATAGANCPYT